MWTHRGFKIEVNEEGKFIAESTDDRFEAHTLDAVKKIIDHSATKALKKREVALPVILLLADQVNRYSNDFTQWSKGTITGYNRTTRAYTGVEPPPTGLSIVDVIPDTPFNRKLVVRVINIRKEWEEVQDNLRKRCIGARVESYTVVDSAHYDRYLKEIEVKYQKALDRDTATN